MQGCGRLSYQQQEHKGAQKTPSAERMGYRQKHAIDIKWAELKA
jgi:hypothetical protein